MDTKLNFRKHMQVNKANSRMAVIRRTYTHLDETVFLMLYKAMVRSLLETNATVWSPHLKKDIEFVEGVQRRATKQVVPELRPISLGTARGSQSLPMNCYVTEFLITITTCGCQSHFFQI